MRKPVRSVVGAVAASAAVAAVVIGSVMGSPAAGAAPAAATGDCRLANGVKHVIEVTFDNVHFNRDNPNVLSDLEQMPALQNFITDHGSLLSNNHTPLIAHTANDTLTNYTGLYGDRQGLGISNSYEVYGANGSVTSESSFAYWTDNYGLDPFPNMAYSPTVPATGSPPSTPPAPWVPFTRAGCDVGAVSTSNMELENADPDLRGVFGANSPEFNQLTADPNPFKDQETNDYLGLAVHCAAGSAFCATAKAVRFGQSEASPTAVTDALPNEPGGYVGYQALFGHRYLQPQLAAAANSSGNRIVGGHTYPVVDASGNLVDLNGTEIDGEFANTPGFPGFGGISAAQSLAYVAAMQEVGVPITYAYISTAHESKGQTGCPSSGTPVGPGDPCYQQTLAAFNQAFATFFQRLADDGINSSNTLFVFSADEGDHLAGANVGRPLDPTASCSGTPATAGYTCSYPTGTIGEQAVAIHGLLRNQRSNTTPFYNEPQGNAVYITGKPGADNPQTRQLERDFSSVTANDAYDGTVENVAQYVADPTVEQLLHFVNADPNRTPSFTVFPKPDFYLASGTSDECASGTTPTNAAMNCSSINNGDAWNHGYYGPEINNTWLGVVGPGVAHHGVDGSSAAEGPSSAGSANSAPRLDTALTNAGTWADHTDIRPTILSLTGLKDDYVGDGRVLAEDLAVHAGQTAAAGFQPLAACYKQLNSSVGQFATDMLVVDTAAVKTGSLVNDAAYQAVSAEIKQLGATRDALATRIKNDLFNAEFANTPLPGDSDLERCQSVLKAADALADAAGK